MRPDQRYASSRPNGNNPLAQVAAAPPKLSPPTLRVLLAIFAILSGAGFAAAADLVGVHWLAIALIVLAVLAAADVVLIARRKRQD